MSLGRHDWSPWSDPKHRPFSTDFDPATPPSPQKAGIYKTSSGTFMYQTTCMSAALDNLQHFPTVSKPQLTSDQRETIRQTVIRELHPLRAFRKAHSHSGVLEHHHTPVKPPPKAVSVDFNMSYVPSSPLTARPTLPSDPTSVLGGAGFNSSFSRGPLSNRASEDSVRSSEIPEDSPGIVWADQRQPKRHSQDSMRHSQDSTRLSQDSMRQSQGGMRSSHSFEHPAHAAPDGPRTAAWTPFALNTRHLSEDTNRSSSDSDFAPTPRRSSGSREWRSDSRRVSHEGIYPHMLGQPSMSSPLQAAAPARSSSEGKHTPSAAPEPVVGSNWAPSAQQNFAKSNATGKKATDLTREEELAAAAASSFFAPTAPRTQPPAKSQPSLASAAKLNTPPSSGLDAQPATAQPPSAVSTAAAVPQQATAGQAQHDKAGQAQHDRAGQAQQAQHDRAGQAQQAQQAQHAQHDRASTPHGTPSSAFFDPQHAQHGRGSTPQGRPSTDWSPLQWAQDDQATSSGSLDSQYPKQAQHLAAASTHAAASPVQHPFRHDRAPTPHVTPSSAFFEPQHAQHSGAGTRPLSAIFESSSSPQLRQHPQQQQYQQQGAVARHSSPAAPGQPDSSSSYLGQHHSRAFHGFAYPHRQTQAELPETRQLRAPMQWQQPMMFPPAGAHSQSAGFGARNAFFRMSADYPQSIPRHRASADFLRGLPAQQRQASGMSDLLSRHSQSSEWESPARSGQGGALGGELASKSVLPGQSYTPKPNVRWSAQQQQALSPQALQMQALQRLSALRGLSPQQLSGSQQHHMGPSRMSCDYPSSLSQLRHTPTAPSALNAATFDFPTWREAMPPSRAGLPPSGSAPPSSAPMYSLFGGSSSLERNPSLGGSSNFGGNLSAGGTTHPPSRQSREARATASELQGTWGSHLDAGLSPPSSSVSRQSSMNPFLQPDSAFSIREAKQLLQHPAPDPNKALPRVDTFASTLHDSWGAHAKHHSPPGNEAILDSRPPRLSSDSVRSNVSQKSQASSSNSRPKSMSRQGSGRLHHGYGYDPESDGWKVDCSSGTQRSFSTYTVAKPEASGSKGIIATAKELLAETTMTAGRTDPSHRGTSQDGACGVKPLVGLLEAPSTPLLKKRRVLETLSFLANNPSIACSICDHGGMPPLLQTVTKASDDLQLEAAEALQALLHHECAQAAFDDCGGFQQLAPSLASRSDSVSQLAGLHVLASVVYSGSRSQPALSGQLQKAGLYDAVIELVQTHSQAEEHTQVSNKGCLDWLEASHVGSPMSHHYHHMEPVPEGSAVSMEPRSNGPAHMESTGGHVTPHRDSPRQSDGNLADSNGAQHAEMGQSGSDQANAGHGALTDSQTGAFQHSGLEPSCSGAPLPSALQPREVSNHPPNPSHPHTLLLDDATHQNLARVSTPASQGSQHQIPCGGQEPSNGDPHETVSSLPQASGGQEPPSGGLHEDPAAEGTEHLDLPDQVTCAALEVLFKLASHSVHLLACRPETLMAALAAQLQHGKQAPAVRRSIQLLQRCCHQPAMAQACSNSGCAQLLLVRAQGPDHIAALASHTLEALLRAESTIGALERATTPRKGEQP